MISLHLHLLLLVLLVLLATLTRPEWIPVCPQDSDRLYLDAELVRNISFQGQQVLVVDNKDRDVKVKCHNPRGAAKIYDQKDRLVAENFSESLSNTVEHVVWKRNSVGLWRTEKTLKC